MTEGIWAAIIGVGGTLIGTLLGWLLGKINVGKLRIKVDFVQEEPYYLNSEGKQKFNYYDFQMVISLFNNSSKNIVFRDVEMLFVDSKRKKLFTQSVKDLDRIIYHRPFYDIEDIGVINIPPQTGLDIKAKIFVHDFEQLKKAKEIYLLYKNKKFNEKKVFVKKCNYEDLKAEIPYVRKENFLKEEEKNIGQA